MQELNSASGEAWGTNDGQCIGCDLWGRINDLGLCEQCAGKLERDLIRQRDWDRSAVTWGLDAERREQVRHQVIGQYGEALELIAPPQKAKRKLRGHSRRRNARRA